MATKPIKQKEFDRLQPNRKPMDKLVVEQREWFANEAGTLLGTVYFDTADNCWGWALLGRDEQGEFRILKMDGNMAAAEAARNVLREQIIKAEAGGNKDLFAAIANPL
jgi:hypothetical protein